MFPHSHFVNSFAHKTWVCFRGKRKWPPLKCMNPVVHVWAGGADPGGSAAQAVAAYAQRRVASGPAAGELDRARCDSS